MSFDSEATATSIPGTFPIALQGRIGAIGQTSEARHSKVSVDALQLVVAGPIAPKTSAYVHHQLIWADVPRPLYEAQIEFVRPAGVPVLVRFGLFEPWLVKSPGKTVLSHFGYSPLEASARLNPDTLSGTRMGIDTHWY